MSFKVKLVIITAKHVQMSVFSTALFCLTFRHLLKVNQTKFSKLVSHFEEIATLRKHRSQ